MTKLNILVTGGCGYIGSHTVQMLSDAGHRLSVVDNLSTGRRQAVPQAELHCLDLRDQRALDKVFAAGNFDAVIHFAASISPPQSIERPLDYYANNVSNTLNALRCCHQHQVGHFVYSSSAAVYGMAEGRAPIGEEAAIKPLTPYGWSKWMGERMLIDVAASCGLRYAVLRYYNVAGADPAGRFGVSPDSRHLITAACRAALNSQPIRIFGGDYDTADGTCVRDYIHVVDLADIHLRALAYLLDGHDSLTVNCGYGHGHSVREVIDVARRVTGSSLPEHEDQRRPGDPPSLVAGIDKIRRLLAWQPRYDDLEAIVRHAWQWEKKLQAGAWDSA